MKCVFETQMPIKFADVDAAGIVYFSRTFEFTHFAIEQFAEKNNIYDFWFKNPEIAVPIRSAHCDYVRPIKLGAKILLTITVEKITDHSVSFCTDITEGGILCANVKTTHVFLNKLTGKKMKVPEVIKRHLSS